jgi:hypothetical protein
VQPIYWLVTVNDLDLALLYYFSQLGRQARIDREPAPQPDKFYPRSAEFFLELAAASRNHRHLQPMTRGIAAHIERLHLGAAAPCRIKIVKNSHSVRSLSVAHSIMALATDHQSRTTDN